MNQPDRQQEEPTPRGTASDLAVGVEVGRLLAELHDVAETMKASAGNEQRPRILSDHRFLTALAAIIAAVVPLTAAVNGWATYRLEQQRQEHEAALAERAQRHAQNLELFDRAANQALSATERARVLEFLILTVGDEDLGMKTWAKRQLTEETYNSRSEGLLRDIAELSSQRDQLRKEQEHLQYLMSDLMEQYRAEMTGTGKSGKVGFGAVAASYASQIDLLKARLRATSEQISQLDVQIDAMREQVQLLLASSASKVEELEGALQAIDAE